mgnify:FL=1
MNRAEALYKLVGTTITMDIPIITATNQFRRKADYLVVAAYPHHVLCERKCESGAVIRESFDIGTLIQSGALRL